MKKIILFIAFTLITSIIISQEFEVKYTLSMDSDNPEMQAQMGLMDNSTLNIITKGDKSKIITNIGGGLVTSTTIINSKENKGLLLTEGFGGKQAAQFDLDKEKKEAEEQEPDFKVEITNETKKILGYTCKKAIIYTEDDGEMVYWFTEEIKPQEGVLGQYGNKDVPGLPLELIIGQDNFSMTFTATELKKKVKETKGMFSTAIPEGYNEISYDAVKKMGMM